MASYTRAELATLGIYVDAKGAITTTRQLAGELDALGKKGAAVAAVAGGSVAPAIGKVDMAGRRAMPGLGRLANQFGSLTAQMTGVHPVAMNVVGALGSFVTSGAVMAGALAGLAALTIAYRKITDGARDAAAETRKLIEDLREWAKMQSPGADPMQAAVDLTRAKEKALRQQLSDSRKGGAGGGAAAGQYGGTGVKAPTVADLAQAIKDRMDAEDRLLQRQIEEMRGTNTHSFEMGRQLPQRGARNRNPFAMPNVSGMIDFQMDRVLARGPNPQEWLDKRIQGKATEGFQMKPMAPMQSNLELRAMSSVPVKLDSLGNRLRDGLKSVSGELLSGLTNIAQQMAFIGGKGKGSQIGGWAGGTIGAGIGMSMGGPIGAAAGTIIGTMAGSLFGGLFDKKKKVASGLDMMATQLARVNEQLRNVPSGYRVRGSQYNATVPESMQSPPVPNRPGGGGGRPRSGGGGAAMSSAPVFNFTVMANNPAQLAREVERALISKGARGGAMVIQGAF